MLRKAKLICLVFITVTILSSVALSFGQSKRAVKFVVTDDGFGPVKIGMTLAQASKALGVRVTRDAGYDGNVCYYASPKGGFKGIAFMMSGRRIVRIDIDSQDYATDKGAKIGDSETHIKRLYEGKYKVYHHSYVDDGHYLKIETKGGKYGIIFETDGKSVGRYRVGLSEQVGYVEGCS